MATLEQLSAQMAQMQQALQQSQTQNQALRTQLDSLQQAQQETRQAAQQAVQQARDEVRQVQAQAMNLGNLGTAVTELSANLCGGELSLLENPQSLSQVSHICQVTSFKLVWFLAKLTE